MQAIKPALSIDGDSPDRIMERSGTLAGFSKSRFVWEFGFLSDSDHAKAYGVSTTDFLFVLANKSGKTLATYHGFGADLPERFKWVINATLDHKGR